MRRHIGMVCLGLLVPLGGGSEAATLRVPSEYATIQAGLDAAGAGDTVLVAPGVYADYETRSIATGRGPRASSSREGVIVRSEGGSASHDDPHADRAAASVRHLRRVRPVAAGWSWRVSRDHEPPAVLRGGVDVECGEVTFRDCVFRDLVGYVTNAGLNVNNGDVVVIGCRFINCKTTGGGAGIYHNDGRIEIRDSYFEDCETGAVAILPDDTGSEAIVEDCTFVNCRDFHSGALGVGLRVAGTAIRDCTFIDNYTTGGNGGALGSAASVRGWSRSACSSAIGRQANSAMGRRSTSRHPGDDSGVHVLGEFADWL